MAEPAPAKAASAAPVRTISALANMPPATNPEEFARGVASIETTAEMLATAVDAWATATRRQLAYGDRQGLLEKWRAVRLARQVIAPLYQGADRIRGGGSSARASYRRFLRSYAHLLNPPPRGKRGFDFTAKGRRR